MCRERQDNFSSFVTFGHVRPAMKAGEFLASCLMAHNSWLSKAMQVLSPQKECAVRCCPYRWWIELELAIYMKAIMRQRELKMQLIWAKRQVYQTQLRFFEVDAENEMIRRCSQSPPQWTLHTALMQILMAAPTPILMMRPAQSNRGRKRWKILGWKNLKWSPSQGFSPEQQRVPAIWNQELVFLQDEIRDQN